MSRRVEFLPAGWRDLQRLDHTVQRRVLQALERYAQTQLGDVKCLQGRPGEYRLRVGKWRIFFHLDDPAIVAVFRIDNRGQAY